MSDKDYWAGIAQDAEKRRAEKSKKSAELNSKWRMRGRVNLRKKARKNAR